MRIRLRHPVVVASLASFVAFLPPAVAEEPESPPDVPAAPSPAVTAPAEPAPVVAEPAAAVAEPAAPAEPAPTPAPPAPAPAPGSDAWVADLMRALDDVDVATRRAALATLGTRLDARLVPAFLYVARRDAEASMRAAALELLAWAPPDLVAPGVTAIARNKAEVDDVRAAACRLLGTHPSPAISALLSELARDADNTVALRERVLAELRRIDAAEADRAAPYALSADAGGRDGFTVVGALSGGYTLGLIGAMAPGGASGVGTVVGAIGGLVLGGAGAYFYARTRPVDLADALFLGTAGAWSVPAGVLLGSIWFGSFGGFQSPASPATMLLVHAAAMVAAGVAVDKLTFSVLDVIETNATTLAALFIASGLLLTGQPNDARVQAGVIPAALAVGFAGGGLLSPAMKLDWPSAVLTAVGAIGGAISGNLIGGVLLPYPVGPLGDRLDDPNRGARVAGLGLVGAGVGLAGVLATSIGWNPSASDAAAVSFMTLAGYLLGAGVPRISDATTAGDAIALGSGLSGLAFGVGSALLLKPLGIQLGRGDGLLVGLGSAFAAWQGLGWPAWYSYQSGTNDVRLATIPLLLTGSALVGLTAIAQYTELDAMRAGWAFSGAVWGAWFGFVAQSFVSLFPSDLLVAALVGSNLGLAVTALALSPLVNLDPEVLAWASLFGLGGAVVGTLGWTLFGGGSAQGFAVVNGAFTAGGLLVGAWLGATALKSVPKAEGSGDGFPLPDLPLPMVSATPIVRADGTATWGASATWVLP